MQNNFINNVEYRRFIDFHYHLSCSQVDTDDEYTKILPQNETEMDTCTIDQQSNSNSPFSNYEGQKLSIIPNAEVTIKLNYFIDTPNCSIPSP